VVLFGSYARGRQTAFSDVDLLVVYADPPRADAFMVVKDALLLRGAEPHVLSESEFAAAHSTWERMTRDGVDLWRGR
jgi:hypothetical protein